MTTTEEGFSLTNLRKRFEEASSEEKNVKIDEYLKGYDELYKFLNMLGVVFGWVSTDVKHKMDAVRVRSTKNPEKYTSLESMLKHETEMDLIKRKARDSDTGTRNFLRLHRALEYIKDFLAAILDLEMEESSSGISQEAYKLTLSRYHPWVVQKAALLAMKMLPTKRDLLVKICGKTGPEEVAWSTENLREAVQAMSRTYEFSQSIYRQYDLLELP